MISVSGLLATGMQTLRVASPGGEGPIVLELRFLPAVQRWMLGLQFGGRSIRGIKLVRSYNLLVQYVLPFGLLVICDRAEPSLINDLSSGRAALYLLDSAERQEVADLISEG